MSTSEIEAQLEIWYDYINALQIELLEEITELHFLAAKARKKIKELEKELRKQEDK